jgi:hypothetical protein
VIMQLRLVLSSWTKPKDGLIWKMCSEKWIQRTLSSGSNMLWGERGSRLRFLSWLRGSCQDPGPLFLYPWSEVVGPVLDDIQRLFHN